MAILRSSQRASGAIPTSSMADVAFLLLIFFLVSTVFDEEKGLALVLPEDVEAPMSAENLLHLAVGPDGIVEVQRGESPQTQRVSAEQVGAVWRAEAAQNPRLIAVVATHPQASYRHMIDVLDQLQAVGSRRISLQTLDP